MFTSCQRKRMHKKRTMKMQKTSMNLLMVAIAPAFSEMTKTRIMIKMVVTSIMISLTAHSLVKVSNSQCLWMCLKRNKAL